MAAQQATGRVCACGCSRSLDGLHGQTLYAPECRKRRKQERWRERYKKNYAAHHRKREDHKTPHPLSAAVWQHRSPTEAPYVPTLKCHVCMDMPWARRPDRRQEHREGYPANENSVGEARGLSGWFCRGCREPYAPEPPPERRSMLRSSAGFTVDHGRLHGHAVTAQGQGLPGNRRPSDKKVKGPNDGR